MPADSPPSLPNNLPPGAYLYLRPLGLLRGHSARQAIAQGDALPLAGGPLAFGAGEIILRSNGRIDRFVATVGVIRRWADRLEGEAKARVTEILHHLTAPRRDPQDRPVEGPRLMGIVNVTPDSFSDGGEHLDPAAAIAYAHTLAQAGADIIDIGGESTRPGATPVPPAIEIARLEPVLRALPGLCAAHPRIRISIDTRRAPVMRAALAAGVDIINDVSALTDDRASLAVAAASDATIILMHKAGDPATMNLAPAYDDVALDVFDYLTSRVAACLAAGIDRRRLIVDPGLGFGKRGRDNLAIMRSLTLFHGLGCPVMLGASRKGFGGESARGATPRDRLPQSLAAALHGLDQGVQLLRVHDVAETRQVVALWLRLDRAGSGDTT
jgi:dihydropteroate synthase